MAESLIAAALNRADADLAAEFEGVDEWYVGEYTDHVVPTCPAISGRPLRPGAGGCTRTAGLCAVGVFVSGERARPAPRRRAMPNPDGVLAAIDACLTDSLSPDAMRWAPDRPFTYVEILRRAATQEPDVPDPATVSFGCNVQSVYDGQTCTWLAELLRVAECRDHGARVAWLCSAHVDLTAADMVCKVCGDSMADPAAEVEDLDALLVDALASVGSTSEERSQLREVYETYLHRLIPAHLRKPILP